MCVKRILSFLQCTVTADPHSHVSSGRSFRACSPERKDTAPCRIKQEAGTGLRRVVSGRSVVVKRSEIWLLTNN